MCDYSLEHQARREAVAGEHLVATAFPAATTVGFAAQAAPRIAVCLKPGTELAFDEPASFSGLFRFLLQAHAHDRRTARFRQVNVDNPLLDHDALEFGNGQLVLLSQLRPGQRAVVIQLPSDAQVATRVPA